MAVGSAAFTCTYSRTAGSPPSGVTFDDSNILTADSNETAPFTDTATVTIDLPPPDLRVLKFVSPYRDGDDGDGIPSFVTNGGPQDIFYSGPVPNPSVWYKLFLSNPGGQTATGVTVSDSNGALPTNANCPARPTTLAAGATYTCFYQRTFTSASPATTNNTVTVAATNETAGVNNDSTATVNVAACTGSNRVVPNMIGLSKSAAPTAWTAAGFSSTLTTWSGSNGSNVKTQGRTAFSCIASTSSGSVSKDTTP
jgi:hypothetical protein